MDNSENFTKILLFIKSSNLKQNNTQNVNITKFSSSLPNL